LNILLVIKHKLLAALCCMIIFYKQHISDTEDPSQTDLAKKHGGMCIALLARVIAKYLNGFFGLGVKSGDLLFEEEIWMDPGPTVDLTSAVIEWNGTPLQPGLPGDAPATTTVLDIIRSHVCTCALQASHTFRRLIDRDHIFSVETLKGQIQGDLKSPITEAWLNLDVNRFNQPGLHPKNLYHGCIVYDIVSFPPKSDKDHKKFMANQINLLHGSVDAASHSPQHICIVTDASTPSLPLQSVMAFRLWHEGDLYNDWSAASLAMSDNAKLQAIVDGICQAYNVGLEDVQQVHVFSNSANMLCLTMDVSHHSGQHLSLSICKVLVPWLQHHPNNCVHFHHITAGVELEDHQLAHILATSTRIEA
jgi:hypothetical protein